MKHMVLLVLLASGSAAGAEPQPRYYAHPARLDAFGVLAPWYQGQNGQWDQRVRIAAETLKRYPWARPKNGIRPAPHYVFSGAWKIAPDGTITIPSLSDWANGDLGQRAAYVLSAFVDYYRYSGDAASIAHMAYTADHLLDCCQTDADHPWPKFLISVPNRGRPYGKADPRGFIQLDIVAEVGLALARVYQVTQTERYRDAALRWASLLAEKRNPDPDLPPWNRYANPGDVGWEDQATGGVAFLLAFFDELLRTGLAAPAGPVAKARDAAEAYLRDTLLPRWTIDDTWGRNYWDWPDPVQAENVTEFAVRYLMEHPGRFSSWRTDARNILTLFLHRTGVSPRSNGGVYSGAWAYPESSACCGRSLWYGPLELAPVYAEYGVRTGSAWALEMARRQAILATYDAHDTGVVEDNIDGGAIVAGNWFKIAHPMALKHVLGIMAWLPAITAPNRENHILRTNSVVTDVTYGKDAVAYTTFNAPAAAIDVLRLAFSPTRVRAGARDLPLRTDLTANGYTVEPLSGGDALVCIRHDGETRLHVEGRSPDESVGDGDLSYTGAWQTVQDERNAGREAHASSEAGAAAEWSFSGNQVRILGAVGPDGGLADVYIDGAKQPAGMDCYCPDRRFQQVLFSKSGLSRGSHALKIVARGGGNPIAGGATVRIDSVIWSAASGDSGFGEGGGSTGAQRVVFGYTGRGDHIDSAGNAWRPATEFILRAGHGADAVKTGWWTERRRLHIAGTPDPELYRYGVHANDFTAFFTVGPERYHARLKFAETRNVAAHLRDVTIWLNDKRVVERMDVAATAGGLFRAVDVVLNDIEPKQGTVELRFQGSPGGEAMIQAIELGPGDGGAGAVPVTLAVAPPSGTLLVNPGFEEGALGKVGALGATAEGFGWTYLFAGPCRSYLWAETAYRIHPEWGLPEIHEGKEALRTHTDAVGHTVVYQQVAVESATRYRASVWVRAVDLHGKGFGTHAGDAAGLWIQELDSAGALLVDHGKVSVTKAGPYTQLATEIKTTEKTAAFRFILDTMMGCAYDQGHVTYDGCVLERVR